MGDDSETQCREPGCELSRSAMVHRNPHQPAGQAVPWSQILHVGEGSEKMLLALAFFEGESFLGRVLASLIHISYSESGMVLAVRPAPWLILTP